MKKIVKTIILKRFDPAKYPNPGLQWHFRVLQALALDEEVPKVREVDDKTLPGYSSIHKRTGGLAMEWGELLEETSPEHAIEDDRGSQRKRKRITADSEDGDTRGSGRVDKQVKKEKKSADPISADRIESLYEQGSLLTVCSPLIWLTRTAEIGRVERGLYPERNSRRPDQGRLRPSIGGLFFKTIVNQSQRR
jgi:Ku70/Ku80 C-terminal arm